MPRSQLSILALVFIAAAALSAAHAQDDASASNDSPRCLRLMAIDHVDRVGDSDLLFYMRGDEIYRNELPHRCPSLRRNSPFMYRVVMNQLCDNDVITFLEPTGFGGFMPAESCALGDFRRIDATQALALKSAAN